jgi:uncharacterized protein YndB with AHSA1/START domain
MTPDPGATADSGKLELFITRTFDAPRELVFRMWIEPKHLARWGGPRDVSFTIVKMDVRPGGAYRFNMKEVKGANHWSQGIYREIVPPKRLVFTTGWSDAEGHPTTPPTLLTLTFEDCEGKTRLTLHQTGFESVTSRDSHQLGYLSTLERLEAYLATLS